MVCVCCMVVVVKLRGIVKHVICVGVIRRKGMIALQNIMQSITFFPRCLHHREPIVSCFVCPFCVILCDLRLTPHHYALLFFACSPFTTTHFIMHYLSPNTTKTNPSKGSQHYESHSLRRERTLSIPQHKKATPSEGSEHYLLSPNTTKATPSEGSQHYLTPNTTKATPSKGSQHHLSPNTTKSTPSEGSQNHLSPNTTKATLPRRERTLFIP